MGVGGGGGHFLRGLDHKGKDMLRVDRIMTDGVGKKCGTQSKCVDLFQVVSLCVLERGGGGGRGNIFFFILNFVGVGSQGWGHVWRQNHVIQGHSQKKITIRENVCLLYCYANYKHMVRDFAAIFLVQNLE